jgi:hypothetical protein
LSCESLFINPQVDKNKRDVRQAVVQPVLAGVRFDRDFLKKAAFGSEIGFFQISDRKPIFPRA